MTTFTTHFTPFCPPQNHVQPPAFSKTPLKNAHKTQKSPQPPRSTFCRKKRKLQGEENVIERGKERRENSKNKSAAHKEQDDQSKHPHAVIYLHSSVRKEVAQDVAAVKRRDRDEI